MGVAGAAAEEAMNNIGGVMMLSYHPTMDRDTEQEAASISLLDHLPPEVPVSSSLLVTRRAAVSNGRNGNNNAHLGKKIQRAHFTPVDEEHN